MSFHPTALDMNTLKRLSKAMKSHSAKVLETPLTLSQSQELLSRAIGYQSWHAATQAPAHEDITKAEDPFVCPGARLKMYLDLGDLITATPSSSANPARVMQVYCDAASDYGDKAQAAIIQKLANDIKQCDRTAGLDVLAKFAAGYSRQEAMAIRMMGSVSWSRAFSAAAQRAESLADLSDYTRLGSNESDVIGMITKRGLEARMR